MRGVARIAAFSVHFVGGTRTARMCVTIETAEGAAATGVASIAGVG